MTQIYNTAKTPKHAARRPAALDRLLQAQLFKALGDPTRLQLLACLAKCGRACSVGEISQCCAVDLSVVSRHLALLARAGVIQATKSGRVVSYRVRYAEISAHLRQLADALDGYRAPGSAGCCLTE